MDQKRKNIKEEDRVILNCLSDGHWTEERIKLEREHDEIVRQMAERNRLKRMARKQSCYAEMR
jgi:hypothetical protein